MILQIIGMKSVLKLKRIWMKRVRHKMVTVSSLIYRNIDKHGFVRYHRSHGRV
jgi:hypothetical protein